MQRIDTANAIDEGLARLCAADPRLVEVCRVAGPVPLRRTDPGFESLVSIIISQQVSKASAQAIFTRLKTLANPLSAQAVLDGGDKLFRRAGLSHPKQKTMISVAEAVISGELDLHGLCQCDRDDAIEQMTAVHGIGLWTAEVYLLSAAGHPDIFPARDVALQSAVGEAFALTGRPAEKELAALSESWRPWRSVAARLFWAYYAKTRKRDAVP